MSMNDVMTQARNANLLSLVQRVQPGSLFYELAAPGEVSQRRIIVGRDEKCDVRVDAQAVSSRHAMIRCGPKQSTVCDLLSSNGTSVNSAPVGSDPVTIQSADRLRFGLEEFFFLEARGLCDFLFFWLKRFLDSQA